LLTIRRVEAEYFSTGSNNLTTTTPPPPTGNKPFCMLVHHFQNKKCKDLTREGVSYQRALFTLPVYATPE
jgi:hypothetical protein